MKLQIRLMQTIPELAVLDKESYTLIEQAMALEGAASLIRSKQMGLTILQQQMNYLNPKGA